MDRKELTPVARAVYDNLHDRSGVLDGIDDDVISNLCEDVAADVLRAHYGR